MRVGFIAGAFDVIHPGYIEMFDEMTDYCDSLWIGLHVDPEVNGKPKPILSIQEREKILEHFSIVDFVFPYSGEEGLLTLLKTLPINIRFLGQDYWGKDYTGKDLPIAVHFLDRSHGWSTTKYKELIYEQVKQTKAERSGY